MADPDLIARLFLSRSSIGKSIASLNPTLFKPTRFGRGGCLSPSPVSRNSESSLPPEDSQYGTHDDLGYLELRLSKQPKAHPEPGFVFGTDSKACDIILPWGTGISGCHFMMTFENNSFADTQEYRLVLKDLDFWNGTIVTYNGDGGEQRSGFRWILSGCAADFSISIIIDTHERIGFRLAVLIPRIGLTGPLYEQVRRFLEPRPVDSLVCRLKVDAPPNTPAGIFGLARKANPILLNIGQRDDGGFAIVTHYDVSTGLIFTRKQPCKKLMKHERETFRNHIKLMSGLKHEHIVECLNNPNDGTSQLDLEWIRGGTLEFRRGEWSFGNMVEAFKQCLKALNYLHTQHRPIIHGGIKPANILVDDTKEGIWIKLADIGLARGGNEAKFILRTSSYCPPEFDSGTVALGHTTAVDIWSMGMTACQLFSPIPLYRKLGKKGCQELIDYVQRKLDDGKTPKISRLLRFILDDMLVIKPDLRKTAGECLDALAMMHRNNNNDGRCEEDSEEENEEDEEENEEDEEDKEDREDENRNDDDGAGGGNGGSRGRRDDHKDGTLTARPCSVVQAHPIRTLKRTGSSSAPSSNGRVAKRQYIPSPPETNDTQHYGEMISEASKSRISENTRPLSRTPLPFRRGQMWASPPSS